MAVIKEKTNNQGVTYEYWVAQPQMSSKDKTTSVFMIGFKDKASRDEGTNFIEKVRIQGTIEKLYPTGEEVYAFVKRSVKRDTSKIPIGIRTEIPENGETNWYFDAEDDI